VTISNGSHKRPSTKAKANLALPCVCCASEVLRSDSKPHHSSSVARGIEKFVWNASFFACKELPNLIDPGCCSLGKYCDPDHELKRRTYTLRISEIAFDITSHHTATACFHLAPWMALRMASSISMFCQALNVPLNKAINFRRSLAGARASMFKTANEVKPQSD
jgi:hypothetical protein